MAIVNSADKPSRSATTANASSMASAAVTASTGAIIVGDRRSRGRGLVFMRAFHYESVGRSTVVAANLCQTERPRILAACLIRLQGFTNNSENLRTGAPRLNDYG
jgi:hypothetical protein